MALIICGECSKEISDKSPACIGCGAPVSISKSTGKEFSDGFYVLINGTQEGPFTFEEIQSMVTDQKITPETLYARPGMVEWKPVKIIILHKLVEAFEENEVEEDKKKYLPGSVFIILIAVAIFALVYHPDHSDHNRRDAYEAAKRLVLQRYPGAKQFSDLNTSRITESGNEYNVVFSVDGLNSFGGPVRSEFEVGLKFDGDNCKFVKMAQNGNDAFKN